MSRKSNNKQSGFTIVELLIATVVFSLLLVVILAAFIRTGDLFYKGVSMSKTQEDARTIVQSISDDIQAAKSAPTPVTGSLPPGLSGFCVGVHRYMYQLGKQVNTVNFGLERDNQGTTCSPGPCTASSGCVSMLDAGMQLNDLTTNCAAGACDVHIHVIFFGGSANGLFAGTGNPPAQAKDATCLGSLTDTDLCAAVDYDSTVLVSS